MTIGPAIRYPAGPITPHGAHYLLTDRVPMVALRSYDDTAVFNLMGGLAIPDRTLPERVELKDIKGLMAPWSSIEQKGASQDGVTWVDALYDPIDVELDVNCVARDQIHLRRMINHLVGSLDVKQQSELSFFTHEMGRWWAKVRWQKPDQQTGISGKRSQRMSLKLRADSGFWETYPNVDQFRFGYDSIVDEFDYLTAEGDPITGWTLQYAGAGTGVLYTDGIQAISTFAGARSVVARHTSFTCDSDNMVVTVQLGSNSQWYWPANTYVDLWARMGNTGTAGANGIRCRLGASGYSISSFAAGVETVIRASNWGWPFVANVADVWTFVAGVEGGARTYQLLRNGVLSIQVVEPAGINSLLGSSYRKAGFGVATASGSVRPFAVKKWSAGANSTVTQSGYLERVNVGDQPMWDRYTCFGPGVFYIANGPSSNEFVKFGPLLPGQVMQIRTDPRKRGVVDLSSKPVSSQTYAEWLKARQDYYSFLSIGGLPPNDSLFGILPPQGNPYTLMKGRFSTPIPPKPSGAPAKLYHVACKIDNGNQDSAIIATGTPYRRMPY